MTPLTICWPESQELFGLKGFTEHCRLINGERGIEAYGSSAYVVDNDWFLHKQEANEDCDENPEIEQIYDDEMEELGLL